MELEMERRGEEWDASPSSPPQKLPCHLFPLSDLAFPAFSISQTSIYPSRLSSNILLCKSATPPPTSHQFLEYMGISSSGD